MTIESQGFTDPHSEESARRHNVRLGMKLFLVYLAVYSLFVFVNAFSPSVMEWRPWGGLNLALLWGFGLIAFAIVLAFVYGIWSRVGVADTGEGER